MHILITGGSGFTGRILCRRLLADGHSLTVLSRQPQRVAELCGADVAGIASLQSISDNQPVDAIINLAGESIAAKRWTRQRKQVLRESRIGVSEQILHLIDRLGHRPRVLISASAVGYYGDRGDTILDEESTFSDDFGHRLCNEWEQTADRASSPETRVCILRIGLVIGKNGGFLTPMLLPFRLGLGGRIGNGRQWMSWIHMDDLVGAILHLLNQDQARGIFNATSPSPVTNREFTSTLAGLLHRPAFLPVPATLLKILLGELSTLLLGGQRALPRRLEQSGFNFRYPRLSAALAEVLG